MVNSRELAAASIPFVAGLSRTCWICTGSSSFWQTAFLPHASRPRITHTERFINQSKDKGLRKMSITPQEHHSTMLRSPFQSNQLELRVVDHHVGRTSVVELRSIVGASTLSVGHAVGHNGCAIWRKRIDHGAYNRGRNHCSGCNCCCGIGGDALQLAK